MKLKNLKYNKLFKKIINDFNYEKYSKNSFKDYLMLNEIIGILNKDLIIKDECYFLNKPGISKFNFKNLNDYDKCEYEKDLNEIYLNDYLKKDIRSERSLIISYHFFEFLYFKLKFKYPDINFRIIISYDVKNPFKLNSSHILFYVKRQGYIYSDEDLESYKLEAIAYIDTK